MNSWIFAMSDVRSLSGRGQSRAFRLPEVGYELLDEKGRVCAEAELAWPDRKVVAVLPEGIDVSEEFKKRGWTVFDATELAKVEGQLKASLGV